VAASPLEVRCSAAGDNRAVTFPKIEFHVHLKAPSGPLCDQQIKRELQQAGAAFDWAGLAAAGQA
jgi:hypothetical protein